MSRSKCIFTQGVSQSNAALTIAPSSFESELSKNAWTSPHLLLSLHTCRREVDKVPFQVQRTQIITEDFSDYAQTVLDDNNVKGLSLAIVKVNDDAVGDVEFGSWGLKTEYGELVDSKVSAAISLSISTYLSFVSRHCSASARVPKRSWQLLSAYSWKTLRRGKMSRLFLLELRNSTGIRSLLIYSPESGS